jgi:S-adenosylmethionine-diacylgycerolhomoserine-N-methlytransferase
MSAPGGARSEGAVVRSRATRSTTATASAATLMDRMYRHQRHVYDFSRKYYLLGRDRLIARLAAAPSQSVLEIGCGTGRNLIAAARRYPGARLHGLDVSSAMLATARHNISGAGLSSRIRLAQADATAVDTAALFGSARFDRVFISYSLSMIPAWREVLAGTAGLLAPGGALHVVDFGGQDGWPRWLRAALRRWLALFNVTPCDDLAVVLQAIAARTGLSITAEDIYRGYARYAVVRAEP